ncbi:MAG: hypothetical protein IIA76_07225 [Proteobacteria bacterium]|nr:hypothetical protein [Pseudomonadota bacterium]
MNYSPLTALSPVDGRYAEKCAELRPLLSEYGLIRFRVLIEIRWLKTLADHPGIAELDGLSEPGLAALAELEANFNEDDASAVLVDERKGVAASAHEDIHGVPRTQRMHPHHLRRRLLALKSGGGQRHAHLDRFVGSPAGPRQYRIADGLRRCDSAQRLGDGKRHLLDATRRLLKVRGLERTAISEVQTARRYEIIGAHSVADLEQVLGLSLTDVGGS